MLPPRLRERLLPNNLPGYCRCGGRSVDLVTPRLRELDVHVRGALLLALVVHLVVLVVLLLTTRRVLVSHEQHAIRLRASPLRRFFPRFFPRRGFLAAGANPSLLAGVTSLAFERPREPARTAATVVAVIQRALCTRGRCETLRSSA